MNSDKWYVDNGRMRLDVDKMFNNAMIAIDNMDKAALFDYLVKNGFSLCRFSDGWVVIDRKDDEFGMLEVLSETAEDAIRACIEADKEV